MLPSYDSAVAELYQAPHASFVEERKRLAADLKASGDKAGAAQLAKLGRPPISAWVVNQLWWHARDAFDALFASAARLRDGDLGATAAHREALTNLRVRATAMLSDAGHGTTETTLRRVSQTLSALAAIGSFEPDPPGALSADRDPPGFEAVGIMPSPAPTAPPKPTSALGALAERKKQQAAEAAAQRRQQRAEDEGADASERKAADEADARRKAAEEAAARAEIEATRRRLEEARAKRLAERSRLEAALRTAQGDVASRERDATRLRTQLVDAEHAIRVAKEVVDDLQARLDGLPAD
jgi:hypothetical protein